MMVYVVTKNTKMDDGSERIVLIGVFEFQHQIGHFDTSYTIVRVEVGYRAELPLYRFVVTEVQRKQT